MPQLQRRIISYEEKGSQLLNKDTYHNAQCRLKAHKKIIIHTPISFPQRYHQQTFK